MIFPMKGKKNWFMFSICEYFLWHWVQLFEIWIYIIFDMFPEFWRLKNVIVYVVCLYVCLCMCAHACMLIAEFHNRHTERSEDNLRGVQSFLPPIRFQVSNSGRQAWYRSHFKNYVITFLEQNISVPWVFPMMQEKAQWKWTRHLNVCSS